MMKPLVSTSGFIRFERHSPPTRDFGIRLAFFGISVPPEKLQRIHSMIRGAFQILECLANQFIDLRISEIL